MRTRRSGQSQWADGGKRVQTHGWTKRRRASFWSTCRGLAMSALRPRWGYRPAEHIGCADEIRNSGRCGRRNLQDMTVWRTFVGTCAADRSTGSRRHAPQRRRPPPSTRSGHWPCWRADRDQPRWRRAGRQRPPRPSEEEVNARLTRQLKALEGGGANVSRRRGGKRYDAEAEAELAELAVSCHPIERWPC